MDNNNEINNNSTDNNIDQQVDKKKKEKIWNKKITHKFEHEHNFNLNINGKKLILPSILVLAIVIFIILNPFEIIIKKDDNKQITKKTIKDIKDPEDKELAELVQKIQEEDSEENYEENTELTGSSDTYNTGLKMSNGKACDVDYVENQEYFNGNYMGNTNISDKYSSVYTILPDNENLYVERYIYKNNNELSFNYLDFINKSYERSNYTIAWNGPSDMFTGTNDHIVATESIIKAEEFDELYKYQYSFELRFGQKIKDAKYFVYKNVITKTSKENDYYKECKNQFFKTYENKICYRAVYKIMETNNRGIPKAYGYQIHMEDFITGNTCTATYTEPKDVYDDTRARIIATSLQFVKQKTYQ